MIAAHEKDIISKDLIGEGYRNVKGKVLISAATGWDDYVMRLFEVGQGGYSANHKHNYPHIVYVLDGEGVLEMDGKIYPIQNGSFAFIENNIQHQLRNTGKNGEVLKFTCIVPKEGHLGFPE